MVEKRKANKLFAAINRGLGIFSPSDENATTVMAWLVPQIKAEELKQSLYYFSKWQLSKTEEEGVKWERLWDPVPGLFQKFSQINKHELTVRYTGRRWWPYIEKYIANPSFIIKYISEQNKEVGNMLKTSLAKNYMQYYSTGLHNFFQMWLWKFPRYHNNCGGVMLFGQIYVPTNLWGFYCRRCGAKYDRDRVEENSYQGKKNKHRQVT